MKNDSKTLNANQAADFLNAHVETIRRLARKGGIPSFKIGKDWRFQKEDLIEWARTHHQRNQPPTVLIVDDDPSIRRLIRQLLEREGYEVIEAEHGARGLDLLKANTVRLILLDLQMPEMNGVAFLEALRQERSEIPVILVTGHPDGHLMRDAMQYSPLMLIPKPFERDHLLRSVKAVAPLQNTT